MSALEVAGLLPHLGELTPAIAERWVAAALAQAAALHEHDSWLYPKDPTRQTAAGRLHEAWRRWANDAEALLLCAERLSTGKVAAVDELRDAVGRTQAMLQLSPETIARRREQARQGDVFSIDEVRRELRSGDSR